MMTYLCLTNVVGASKTERKFIENPDLPSARRPMTQWSYLEEVRVSKKLNPQYSPINYMNVDNGEQERQSDSEDMSTEPDFPQGSNSILVALCSSVYS